MRQNNYIFSRARKRDRSFSFGKHEKLPAHCPTKGAYMALVGTTLLLATTPVSRASERPLDNYSFHSSQSRTTLGEWNTSSPSFLPSDLKVLKLRQEILRLGKLEPGWNGEDALPIDADAVKKAFTIIDSPLARVDLIENVYPTPNGTVCVEWSGHAGDVVNAEIASDSLGFYFDSVSTESFCSPELPFQADSLKSLFGYLDRL